MIYIREHESPGPDQMFAIAHELRHVWQIRYHEWFYFSGYRTIDQCMDMEEYNLQPAEIDANAFAGLAMMGYFELKPQYMGMPETVRDRIHERLDELVREYATPAVS
jgi:Zn-dependent peptidase ImmA (M78 family)